MILLSLLHPAWAFETSVSDATGLEYALMQAALSTEDDTIHLTTDIAGTLSPIQSPSGSITIDSTGGPWKIPTLQVEEASISLHNLIFSDFAAVFVPIEYRNRVLSETVYANLFLRQSLATLSNVQFSGGYGNGVIALGSDVTLQEVEAASFNNNTFFESVNLAANFVGGSLTVTGGSYHENAANVFRIWGDLDRPADFSTCSFFGNSGPGGADIEAHNTNLTIDSCSFKKTRATSGIGIGAAPIAVRVSEVKCVDCTFEDTGGEDALAFWGHQEGQAVSFESNNLKPSSDLYRPFYYIEAEPVFGGSASFNDLHYLVGQTTVVPQLIDANDLNWMELGYSHLDFGGANLDTFAFHLNNTTARKFEASFNHVQMCNAGKALGTQSYPFLQTTRTNLTVQRSIFSNFYAENFVYGGTGDNYAFYNNTFWGVSGSEGLITGAPESLSFVNNVVAEGTSGVWADDDILTGEVSYNLWYHVTIPLQGNATIFKPDTNLETDPMINGYDPTDCTDYPTPDAGSPVTDAGYPTILDEDGSVADIGAIPALEDTGVDTGEDTGEDSGDDTAVDSDLPDLDGDGYPEGSDCDDADAAFHPDANDVANDGLDQDCNGSDTLSSLSGGANCGCAANPAPATLGAAAAALLLLRRRRRC